MIKGQIKKSIRLSLSIKVALLFALYSLIILVFSFFILRTIVDDTQNALYRERLAKISLKLTYSQNTLVRTGLEDSYRSFFMDEVLKEIRSEYYTADDNRSLPFLVDSQFRILLHPVLERGESALGLYPFLENCVDDFSQQYIDLPGAGKGWCISTGFPGWQWRIYIVVPLSQKYEMVFRYLLFLAPLSLLFLLIVSLIVFEIIKKETLPIQTLTEASNAMAAGDLIHPIPTDGENEIYQLGQSFLRMRDIIQSNLEELQEEIDQRIAAEESQTATLSILKEREDNLKITLNSISDAVIVVNPQGNIVSINPSAERLSGWGVNEAVGCSFIDVFPLIERESRTPRESPVQMILSNHNFHRENNVSVLFTREGTERIVECSGSLVKDDTGLVLGVVLVFRDLTEREKLDQMIRHSQKMEAVGQLAGGIAHDFNNMLGGILGAVELLKSSIKDEDEQQYLNLIIQSAERASGLTSQLLTFSCEQYLKKSPLIISGILSDSINLLSRTINKNIRIITDLSEDEVLVMADSSWLQSVFINLGINASHAMPDGGEICFKTIPVFLDQEYCRNSSFSLVPGRYIEIDVKDTGSGIAREHLDHIFEPFFTTKSPGKGTGLGLAAAYGTILDHAGAILVDSDWGRGTVFKILLPIVDVSIPAVIPEISQKGEGLILVAEDEEILRITCLKCLEQLGYKVLLAENGIQALEMFATHQSELSLVLMDIIMPEMSGRECFYEIRKISPEFPIILTSGFLETRDLDALKSDGLCAFLLKPYRQSELSRLVDECIKKSREKSRLLQRDKPLDYI